MEPAPRSMWARVIAAAGPFALLAFFVATVVYPIVAQVHEPPLEPAYTLMYWQALWNDGFYGSKYNWAVSWFCILAGTLGPVMWVGRGVGAWRVIRDAAPLPDEPGWHAIAVSATGGGTLARAGLATLALSLGFGAICWWDPGLLTPVGFIAQLLLIVWPFALVAGPLLLIDALPPGAVVGTIEALEHTPAAQGQRPRFHLLVGGRRFELAEAAWRSLAAGDRVVVRFSPGFDRVVDLRVRPAPERIVEAPPAAPRERAD